MGFGMCGGLGWDGDFHLTKVFTFFAGNLDAESFHKAYHV